jgi:hypothetical protein
VILPAPQDGIGYFGYKWAAFIRFCSKCKTLRLGCPDYGKQKAQDAAVRKKATWIILAPTSRTERLAMASAPIPALAAMWKKADAVAASL